MINYIIILLWLVGLLALFINDNTYFVYWVILGIIAIIDSIYNIIIGKKNENI